MARAPRKKVTDDDAMVDASVKVPEQNIMKFQLWLVGDTPLICHAWSEKARTEMLAKQRKTAKEGRAAKDPEADFLNSLYEMGENQYGFPVGGVKKCLLSAAHKERGMARTQVAAALWVHGKMHEVKTAYPAARCNMPLVRIWSGRPQMREDMVRVGVGLNKKADLAYRAEFWPWAIRLRGEINLALCQTAWLPFLASHSGRSTGIGDWRNEKSGVFGAFHVASIEEERLWEQFRRGQGPLPAPVDLFDEDDDAELEAAE